MIDFLMLDVLHLLSAMGVYQDPSELSAWPLLKGPLLLDAGRPAAGVGVIGLAVGTILGGLWLIVRYPGIEAGVCGLLGVALAVQLAWKSTLPLQVRGEGLDLYGVFFPWNAVRSVRWTPRGKAVIATGNGFTCTISLPESVREEFRGAVDRARAEHASRDSVAQADMRAQG